MASLHFLLTSHTWCRDRNGCSHQLTGFIDDAVLFIPAIDSMTNRHSTWLTATLELEWGKDLASSYFMGTSHAQRQGHNGYSHQVTGIIDEDVPVISVIDSMIKQHCRCLKATSELEWREDLASLHFLLTSHARRQGHHGYSHQVIGIIYDHVPVISAIDATSTSIARGWRQPQSWYVERTWPPCTSCAPLTHAS